MVRRRSCKSSATAALGGGHGVQAFQLGPLEVVKQRQAGLPGRRLDGRTGPPGQQQRAGAHALQGAGNFIADALLRHGQQGKICQAGILGPDDAQARRPQNLRSRLLAGIMPDHAKGFWHKLFPPFWVCFRHSMQGKPEMVQKAPSVRELQTVEKVLCRGAQCAPVLVSCMSGFPGNALPRQASGQTMFALTVSTMGKWFFDKLRLPL